MKKRNLVHLVLGATALAVLLLTIGLLLQPALAAPSRQELPQLTITKTADGDGAINPGQVVRFTITVQNTGAISATNVTVQDDYDQVALPSIEIPPDPTQSLTGAQNDGDVITWLIGDVAPGAVWTASYSATAAAAFAPETATVDNHAVVSAEGIEIAEATVSLRVRAPHLTLTRQRARLGGEGDIGAGDTVRYTIRYNNDGTAGATNVVIEEAFDGELAEQVGNITESGALSGTKITWDLGTVEAGSSGEVSYEITLKSALSQGDIDVQAQATIRAGNAETAVASDTFTLSAPLLRVQTDSADLNGGTTQPGDTLRFTIHLKNEGTAPAVGLTVRDDYDAQLVAELSEISNLGNESSGAVEWIFTDPLQPDGELVLSYKMRLSAELAESATTVNVTTASMSGVEVARDETTVTIEAVAPTPTSDDETQGPQVFSGASVTLAILVGVLAGGALAVVGVLLRSLLKTGQWKESYLREIVELVAVIIIVAAVLILAMGSGIRQDGAISILSGVAGYMLGRKTSN